MHQYKLFTDRGTYTFEASSDQDAARLGMFYAWRDGEQFIKVESAFGGRPYTIRLCIIDKSNSITTL